MAPELLGVRIHPTACVDLPCEIGEGSAVWHFCHVMENSRIGSGCSLGQNVMVASGVQIGDRVRIQNNVSVYEGVTLEDDVFCGPSMVFTNVINPRSEVPKKDAFRSTLVRRGATLGANSTVVCGATIGCFALVGAGAVVVDDVPDYALMLGVPARRRGWVCRCGETLPPTSNDDETSCRSCGNRYRERGERLESLKEVQQR